MGVRHSKWNPTENGQKSKTDVITTREKQENSSFGTDENHNNGVKIIEPDIHQSSSTTGLAPRLSDETARNQDDDKSKTSHPESPPSVLALILRNLQQRLTRVANQLMKQPLLSKNGNSEHDWKLLDSSKSTGTTPIWSSDHPIVDLAKSLQDTAREARCLLENLATRCSCSLALADQEEWPYKREFTGLKHKRNKETFPRDVEGETFLPKKKLEEENERNALIGLKDFSSVDKETFPKAVEKRELEGEEGVLVAGREVSREKTWGLGAVKRKGVNMDGTMVSRSTCETILEEEEEEEEEMDFTDLSRCSSVESDFIFETGKADDLEDIQLIDLEDDPDYCDVLTESGTVEHPILKF